MSDRRYKLLKQGLPGKVSFKLSDLVAGDTIVWNPTTHLWDAAPLSGGGGGSVSSVFGRTGAVTALAGDYSAFYATLAQGALADSSVQPGDNISVLTNDAGYITAAGAPVTSVFGRTGAITAVRTDYATYYSFDKYSWKATPTTPIFIGMLAQSNGDDVETAVTNFAMDPDVWVYQSKTPYAAAGTQDTLPSGGGFHLINVDPTDALITDAPLVGPNVGYRHGNHGSIAVSYCNTARELHGRPVVLMKLAFSGAPIELFLEKNVDGTPASGDTMVDRFNAFVAYMLANEPMLADVDHLDEFLWIQSESNAGAMTSANLTPVAYNTKWDAVYEALIAAGTIDRYNTDVILFEATQYVLNTGSGSLPGGGGDPMPWRWEGLNAVVRYHNELVTLVSSIGIPWNTTAEVGNPLSAAYVHFTGDGLNQYGELAKRSHYERSAVRLPNTELWRDTTPRLAANLDFDDHHITDFGGTITSSVADGATAKAIVLDTANNYTTSGAKLLSVQNLGVEKFYITKDGAIVGPNFDSNLLGGGIFAILGAISVGGAFGSAVGTMNSAVSNGGTAKAWVFDTVSNYTTSGAKLISVQNQTVEKLYITKDGDVVGNLFDTNFLGSLFLVNKALSVTGLSSLTGINNVSSLQMQGVIKTAAGGYTIASTDFGVFLAPGYSGTCTFPAISSNQKRLLFVANTSGSSVTLSTTGINIFGGAIGATTMSLANGSTRLFFNDGSNTWHFI